MKRQILAHCKEIVFLAACICAQSGWQIRFSGGLLEDGLQTCPKTSLQQHTSKAKQIEGSPGRLNKPV